MGFKWKICVLTVGCSEFPFSSFQLRIRFWIQPINILDQSCDLEEIRWPAASIVAWRTEPLGPNRSKIWIHIIRILCDDEKTSFHLENFIMSLFWVRVASWDGMMLWDLQFEISWQSHCNSKYEFEIGNFGHRWPISLLKYRYQAKFMYLKVS